jgi:hypothetical protein
VRQREADTLLRFVRVARPVAATAVTVTEGSDDDRQAQADRLVRHWRNELVPLAALPGVGGRFAQPVREVLAATVQGLLVLSLAQLCDVADEDEQVRLVARLVLRDDPPPGWTSSTAADLAPEASWPDPFAKRDPTARRDIFATPASAAPPAAEDDHRAAGATSPADPAPDLGDEPDPLTDSPEETETWKLVAQRIPITIVRAARELWTIHRLAGRRAEGRLWHRALGSLPAVGIVGATLGERHALSDLATAAYAELGLTHDGPAATPSVTARAASAAKSTAKGVASCLPAAADIRKRSPFGRS